MDQGGRATAPCAARFWGTESDSTLNAQRSTFNAQRQTLDAQQPAV
jgi:hypothetical protein